MNSHRIDFVPRYWRRVPARTRVEFTQVYSAPSELWHLHSKHAGKDSE
jgi:hypothetical protein